MFTLLIIYGIKNILTDTRKVMTTQFSNDIILQESIRFRARKRAVLSKTELL